MANHRIRNKVNGLPNIVQCGFWAWSLTGLYHTASNCFLVASLMTVLTLKANAESSQIDSIQNELTTKITLTGMSSDVRSNIEVMLGVDNGVLAPSSLGFPRSNEYILRQTKKALQALGYYSPEIKLEGDHQHWVLEVKEGQGVVWKEIKIDLQGEAQNNPSITQLITNHPFNQGVSVNHGVYENFKQKLISQLNEQGYLQAQFSTQRLEVLPEKLSANVIWQIDSKQRFTFMPLSLQGSKLSKTLLDYYIKVEGGSYYEQSKIIETQQLLNRSGYFKFVDVSQQIDYQTKQVLVAIKLTDIDKYELKTSLGYGTDSKQKLSMSWRDNRVNDDGDNYTLSLAHSQIEDELKLQYVMPLKDIKADWINQYSYRIRSDQLGKSKQSKYDSKLMFKHNANWSSQWKLTIATEEFLENEAVTNFLEYLVPSLQLDYYSVTDPFSAKQGWRWQGILNFSHDSISDPDINFVQYRQQLKYLQPLSQNWRLLLRSELGTTLIEQSEFNLNMPSDYRFFAGGDISVRGYEYQTLAPLASDGSVFGGKHLITLSSEIDYQFSNNWRWAFFIDNGNAFNDWNTSKLNSALGTGIRWVTPIGSLRFDIAKALNGHKGWNWHLTIGPDL
ncbi:autotransporter assembly complex protein TamA [Aliikangiella sp. IMCC44632]